MIFHNNKNMPYHNTISRLKFNNEHFPTKSSFMRTLLNQEVSNGLVKMENYGSSFK